MLNNEVLILHNMPGATPSPSLPLALSMNFSLVMFTVGVCLAELVHAGQSFASNTWRAFDADTVMAAAGC